MIQPEPLDPWAYWPSSEDRTAVDVVRVIAVDPVQAIPLIVANNPGAVVANYITAKGLGFGAVVTPKKVVSDLTDMWEEGKRQQVQDILAVQWMPGADAEQDKAVGQLRDQFNQPGAGLGQLWVKLMAEGIPEDTTITTTNNDEPTTPSKRKKYIRYALIGVGVLVAVAVAFYLFKKLRR